MNVVAATEVTELAGAQATVRALIATAFAERLPEVAVEVSFHRHWNGGWRARAMSAGRPPLDFALLRIGEEVVAFPVPFPPGWRVRGVAGSCGGRFSSTADGELVRVPPIPDP